MQADVRQVQYMTNYQCDMCNDMGWVWGYMIPGADEDTQQDTMTKYTCPECDGDTVQDMDPITRPDYNDWPNCLKAALVADNRDILINNLQAAADKINQKSLVRDDMLQIANKWSSSDHMRLHAGEMTAQELRTCKAVVNAIIAELSAYI